MRGHINEARGDDEALGVFFGEEGSGPQKPSLCEGKRLTVF
jgi:hypothetical protein